MKCFVVTRINWILVEETDETRVADYSTDDQIISNCFPVRVFTGVNAENQANEYVLNQTKANTPHITYQVDDCIISAI